MEGGIERLREVIVDDKLGISAQLEAEMQSLVDTYQCEWTTVVNDPARRKLFRQFVNCDDTEPGIEIVSERGQNRPADWPKDGAEVYTIQPPASRRKNESNGTTAPRWVDVGAVDDFPKDGGAAIKYGQVQIAIFRFDALGRWYACQNMCPHKRAFVLSRGVVGTQGEEAIVACPLHKKTYSLETGACLTGEGYTVKVFPVRVAGERVELLLPPSEQLDALLATEVHCVKACHGAADVELQSAC
jgi:NAD(P)H-dependent nitrite reductase small subunit